MKQSFWIGLGHALPCFVLFCFVLFCFVLFALLRFPQQFHLPSNVNLITSTYRNPQELSNSPFSRLLCEAVVSGVQALLGSKCNPVSHQLLFSRKCSLMLHTLCSDGSVSPCSALTPTVDILKKKYGLVPESS